jgi:hypothetical protein
MATWLKQSTAVDIGLGPFVDSADGVTAEDSLTISQADVRLKKNAGAWAQKNDTNAATHEENGWYEVALNTTDTNTLGILLVNVSESGALPVWREFLVVPANVYDSLVSGTEYLYGDSFHQKWTVTGATLQPKKQDGTTNTDYSRALTTDETSDPITGSG